MEKKNPHVLSHQPVMHFSLLPVLRPVFDSRPPRPKKSTLETFSCQAMAAVGLVNTGKSTADYQYFTGKYW